MKMSEAGNDNHEMKAEYDFSHGVRGKHYRAYRDRHSVRIAKEDGSVVEHHFTLEEGDVMIDADLRAQFPDSDSVNTALRSLLRPR
jgi:hypothetical protein